VEIVPGEDGRDLKDDVRFDLGIRHTAWILGEDLDIKGEDIGRRGGTFVGSGTGGDVDVGTVRLTLTGGFSDQGCRIGFFVPGEPSGRINLAEGTKLKNGIGLILMNLKKTLIGAVADLDFLVLETVICLFPLEIRRKRDL